MLSLLYKLFFFFSSRRRHTRYWRDWSSDVCSSDLRRWGVRLMAPRRGGPTLGPPHGRATGARPPRRGPPGAGRLGRDRKRVGEGKRVDLGGRRNIKKKKDDSHVYSKDMINGNIEV